MANTARRRTCTRCGQVEMLRQYGQLLAWGEEAPVNRGE
jgi:hypothetical protein